MQLSVFTVVKILKYVFLKNTWKTCIEHFIGMYVCYVSLLQLYHICNVYVNVYIYMRDKIWREINVATVFNSQVQKPVT